MATNRITLQIIGADEDSENVRFDDFLRQLEAVRKALAETDRVLSDGRTVYFRVSDLRHSSPAAIEIEAVPLPGQADHSVTVISRFCDAVAQIQMSEEAPRGFDYPALQAFKDLAPYRSTSIRATIISRNGDAVTLSHSLPQTVERILGPDISEEGSITGFIDQINVHGQNVFTVYPTTRRPKLRCLFPRELRGEAVRAVGQYAEVFGRMKYKTLDLNPYEMQVHEIDVFPPADELPSLGSLRGVAPGATGGRPSEEFVRDLRKAWDA